LLVTENLNLLDKGRLFSLLFFAAVLSVAALPGFAQQFSSGASVFVYREARGSRDLGRGVRPKTSPSGNKGLGKTAPGPKSTLPAVEEPILPEYWLNEEADLAVEERKVSDSEPFLSLTEGYLNSRYTFCESPLFPNAALRDKKKLVELKTLVTVAKYGGLLDAHVTEGDASFRASVYKSLVAMQFKQSYFMGRPIRIEGMLSFSQNPANTLLCRDASRDVEIPALIEGGDVTSFAKGCEMPRFPTGAKSAGLKTVDAKVEIIVGEDGKVVDAKLISGNPAFGQSAINEALKMTFPRSLIAGKYAKVRGTFNFSQTAENTGKCG